MLRKSSLPSGKRQSWYKSYYSYVQLKLLPCFHLKVEESTNGIYMASCHFQTWQQDHLYSLELLWYFDKSFVAQKQKHKVRTRARSYFLHSQKHNFINHNPLLSVGWWRGKIRMMLGSIDKKKPHIDWHSSFCEVFYVCL